MNQSALWFVRSKRPQQTFKLDQERNMHIFVFETTTDIAPLVVQYIALIIYQSRSILKKIRWGAQWHSIRRASSKCWKEASKLENVYRSVQSSSHNRRTQLQLCEYNAMPKKLPVSTRRRMHEWDVNFVRSVACSNTKLGGTMSLKLIIIGFLS